MWKGTVGHRKSCHLEWETVTSQKIKVLNVLFGRSSEDKGQQCICASLWRLLTASFSSGCPYRRSYVSIRPLVQRRQTSSLWRENLAECIVSSAGLPISTHRRCLTQQDVFAGWRLASPQHFSCLVSMSSCHCVSSFCCLLARRFKHKALPTPS